MAGKYVITTTSSGEFMFNLVAGNNEKILTSESYTTKDGATNGIESCKTNSGQDERYERRSSAADQPYFVLKAANGEVIGTSEMYSSADAMENGIEACKREGPAAETSDST